MKNEIANNTPNAVKSLGENIFIKVPLYETKDRYNAIYINSDLFKKYFKDANTDFKHMTEVIESSFSTTLDIKKSNKKQVGFAYIDMQDDPLKLSLSGNLGSGRAFYQGEIFNIKGEKTPLAKSSKDEYSNGVLEYEKAIYETIATNSLFEDVNIKLSPILAILDTNENCRVSWKKNICKRAKVIRLDVDGSLNRISHIFKAKKTLSADELLYFAESLGNMEGEKFLQRIEHGAWSAGNISEKSHMIDFDTVCTVKYRTPQFSFSAWHIDNYFGFESVGQLKIIKSLVKDKSINIDNVQFVDLKEKFIATRENYITDNFTKLMGFNIIDLKYRTQIKKVVKLFNELSRKCYPVHQDLSCKRIESTDCSPFDFSKFFRYYPLLKLNGDFDEYKGLEYLMNPFKEFEDFNIKDFPLEDKNDIYFAKHALKALDNVFIHSFDELLSLSKKCVEFIKLYDNLFDKILKNNKEIGKIATNAYIKNADRTHLIMPHSMAGPIDDEKNKLNYEHLNNIIKTTILSNKRSGLAELTGLKLSNIEIFKEGFFATLHGDKMQHKISLNLFNNLFEHITSDKYFIKVNNKKYDCDVCVEKDIVSMQSPFFDNLNLLPEQYKSIVFYKNNKKIYVNNFIFKFTENKKVSDFAYLV